MISHVPPSQVGSTSPTLLGSTSAIDILASIQILLVQDYDDQLKSLGKQIKGIMKTKQAYRREIEKLNKLLMRETKKKGGKDNKEFETVLLKPDEINGINEIQSFVYDTETDTLKSSVSEVLTGEDQIKGVKNKYENKWIRNPRTGRYEKKRVLVGAYVRKDAIEKKLEIYKQKLESLNEQSELMSLSLQSLTNQRKIAVETVSNLINKQHEASATIVRNMKG